MTSARSRTHSSNPEQEDAGGPLRGRETVTASTTTESLLPARVLVCGSRGWTDRKLIKDVFADLVLATAPSYPTIVHGDARGADRLCADEAGKAGLLVEAHPADWDRLGKRAGLVRNEEMASLGAALCIGFWDGRSTGTRHMLDTAAFYGIPTRVVMDEPCEFCGDGPCRNGCVTWPGLATAVAA